MKSIYSLFLLALISCSSPSKTSHFKGVAMTVPYEIIVGKQVSSQEKIEIEEVISKCFETINQVYNNWNPESEVSKLNVLNGKSLITKELRELLLLAKKVHLKSQGRFDPTVWPIAKRWKEGKLEGIEKENESVGFEKIHIENNLFWKENEKTALDLSGIAKGHGVDLVLESLERVGLQSLYVEWGGEIRTLGKHPAGRPWKIGIRGLGSIEMENGAVATSGDYNQVYEYEGKLYTHIIDPQTKKPLQITLDSIASATVFAPSCAYADAIATALMLFDSIEEANAWIKTLEEENIKCWITTRRSLSESGFNCIRDPVWKYEKNGRKDA